MKLSEISQLEAPSREVTRKFRQLLLDVASTFPEFKWVQKGTSDYVIGDYFNDDFHGRATLSTSYSTAVPVHYAALTFSVRNEFKSKLQELLDRWNADSHKSSIGPNFARYTVDVRL